MFQFCLPFPLEKIHFLLYKIGQSNLENLLFLNKLLPVVIKQNGEMTIGYFQVALKLIMKARLSAKFFK